MAPSARTNDQTNQRRMEGSGTGGDVPEELRLTWSRLLSLFIERRDAMFQVLRRHGLTPPHGHALALLLGGPVRMRDLADVMTCDASYITAVTDRLEELGFAARTPSAGDRRVKEVTLTGKGRRVAEEVRQSFSEPPDALATLSPADRRELARLCALMVPDIDLGTDLLRPNHRSA